VADERVELGEAAEEKAGVAEVRAAVLVEIDAAPVGRGEENAPADVVAVVEATSSSVASRTLAIQLTKQSANSSVSSKAKIRPMVSREGVLLGNLR
jgi:hypothetical protein